MPFPVRMRLPTFEVSLVLIILLVCWAGIRLSQLLRQMEREQPIPVAALAPANKQQAEDFFRLQGEINLPAEYTTIAKCIQTNVVDLQRMLRHYRQRREGFSPTHFSRVSSSLREWIAKQHERMTLERLDTRSREVLVRMSSPLSQDSSTREDLGSLLQKIGSAYSNYLLNARDVVENAGRPLIGDLVARRYQTADQQAQNLLQTAEAAQSTGDAMAHFFGDRLQAGLAALTPVAAQEKAVEPPNKAASIQKIVYSMVVAVVGLCLVLMMAIYRRTVVTPLRSRLGESTSIIEQQNKLAHFGQLAASLAHEIRNPLTAINARLYTLQKSLTAGTPEHEDAVIIRNEISRLDGIVRDFLSSARPAEPKLVSTSAGAICTEVGRLMTSQLAQQAIVLKVEVAEDLTFRADPGQLKQVLHNLIRNAAESIVDQGQITLRAHSGDAVLRGQTTPAVILEVEDSGAGIPAEVQPRLFDPFFSTKENGTGLGLSISARIIDRHGGALGFETRMGEGTTFRISLPVVHG